jgi:hypothetical protein
MVIGLASLNTTIIEVFSHITREDLVEGLQPLPA